MATPGPAVPFRRLRLGFGIAAVVSGIGATGTAAVADSFPGGHFTVALFAVALFGLTTVAWLVAAVLAVAARRFDPVLVVPPVLLGLVIGVGLTDLPLRARFAVARPAFEEAVAARGEAGSDAPCPERVGTFRIFWCSTDGSITHFYTSGGFLDAVGFAYAPDGVPADSYLEGAMSYDLLRTSWYTFSQAF